MAVYNKEMYYCISCKQSFEASGCGVNKCPKCGNTNLLTLKGAKQLGYAK